MKKSVIKVVAFLLCASLALAGVWNALKFKYGDGIANADLMHSQREDSIDVLVLGSSHAFENINTETLWDDRGIASFVYGGSVQPLWDTYYYLQDALEHQSPKLIVIDAYRAIETREYVVSSRISKNTLGLSWDSRIDAISESAPESDRLDYILQYPLWHSRYSNLSRADFTADIDCANFTDNKGFLANTTVGSSAMPDLASTTGVMAPIPEKSEYWLRKTIELAKSSGAKVVLVNAPYPEITEAEQEMFNSVGNLAAAEGVPYLDGNMRLAEMGLDYTSDIASDGHLNWRGCIKYTRWLEDNIDLSCLPDHRGDEAYSSWDKMAQDIRARAADSEATAQASLAAKLSQVTHSEVFGNDIYNIYVVPDDIRTSPYLAGTIQAITQAQGLDSSTSLEKNTVVVTRGAKVLDARRLGGEKSSWKTGRWPDGITVTTISQGDYDNSIREQTSVGAGVTIEIGSSRFTVPDGCLTSISYDAFTRTILWADYYSPADGFQARTGLS